MKTRVELYQLKHGDKTWNFTSARKTVVHNSIEYLPVRGLQRTVIEDESIDKCDTEVTFPQMNLLNADGDDLKAVFINKIFYGGVTITILELLNNETLVLHKGRVTQPKFDESADTMTLVCETGESYLNRNILTRKFQATCPNSIYDRFCGLSFEQWSFDVTITAISDLNISFTVNPTLVIDENGDPILDVLGAPVMETKTYPDGYLYLGLLVKDGVHTLLITGSGTGAKLYRQHIGLQVGDVVRVAPGCDQSLKMCHEKFANNLRFAGHPFIPNSNPIYTQLIK
ncbi:phage BR0599 family protein [Escherichia coli]|nr:phage BR0599 family protein [Escherichia coli]